MGWEGYVSGGTGLLVYLIPFVRFSQRRSAECCHAIAARRRGLSGQCQIAKPSSILYSGMNEEEVEPANLMAGRNQNFTSNPGQLHLSPDFSTLTTT